LPVGGIKDVKNSDSGSIPVMFIEKKPAPLPLEHPPPMKLLLITFV